MAWSAAGRRQPVPCCSSTSTARRQRFFGHDVGDAKLREVARRLPGRQRARHRGARVGGDEFPGAAEGGPDVDGHRAVAQRIIDALLLPSSWASAGCGCLPIGIALFPTDGLRDQLMPHADSAMQAAAWRRRRLPSEPHMNAGVREQAELQRTCTRRSNRAASSNCTTSPVRKQRRVITGAEARWCAGAIRPRRLAPGLFIPVAGRFGLIGGIGQLVIDEARRQTAEWLELGPVHPRGHQSVGWSCARTTWSTARPGHPAPRARPRLLTARSPNRWPWRRRPSVAGVRAARPARRAAVHRRLRHRLLQPGVPAPAAGRGAEDRPFVRARPGKQRRRAPSSGGGAAGARAPGPVGGGRGRARRPARRCRCTCAATNCRASLFARPMTAQTMAEWAADIDRPVGAALQPFGVSRSRPGAPRTGARRRGLQNRGWTSPFLHPRRALAAAAGSSASRSSTAPWAR